MVFDEENDIFDTIEQVFIRKIERKIWDVLLTSAKRDFRLIQSKNGAVLSIKFVPVV